MGKELKKYDYRYFDSIDQMINFVGKTSTNTSSGRTNDPEWSGSTTYEEAVTRVVRGDDELVKMVRGFDKLDINVPVTGTRRRITTAVAGFAPHVPNYIAGVPNNMLWCKEEKVSKKVLTFVYGSNILGGVSVEDMAKVSARVLSCIMSLERKGYRVNLLVANVAYWHGCTGFVVKLKDAGQHLDPLKIAFPMISAAWNRRFGFKFREMCGWPSSSGMGSSQYGNDLRRWLAENNVKYDVAFGFHDAEHIQTIEELEKLFLKNIKK